MRPVETRAVRPPCESRLDRLEYLDGHARPAKASLGERTAPGERNVKLEALCNSENVAAAPRSVAHDAILSGALESSVQSVFA